MATPLLTDRRPLHFVTLRDLSPDRSTDRRGLDAALRRAQIDEATLVVVQLEGTVTASHTTGEGAPPLLTTIAQRAVRSGVTVESRTLPGRSYRDAICELVAKEEFDTVIVASTDSGPAGLARAQIGWLLEHVEAEIFVIGREGGGGIARDPP